MKNHLILCLFAFSVSLSGTQYVPLVDSNAEWRVLYTNYPFQFQLAKSVTPQVYAFYGDTVIDNLTYKKIGLKTQANGQSSYVNFGVMREQDKKVYYRGMGFFTAPSNSPADQARIKSATDCMSAENWFEDEEVLYDFNAQKGESLHWGFEYHQVIQEDSVLVGSAYRRRLRLSNGDEIVEGIGSIVRGLLSMASPIPICGEYYHNWDFTSYSHNSVTLFRAAKTNPSKAYQTVYSHRKAFFTTDNHKTETLRMDSCAFLNDSVFYPARTVQLIGDECYDPQGGGWAGKKIVFDGPWNYFFTADNDTVKIKTDAVLNESWTLYQKYYLKITATVTRWDTASVLGLIDSVKTITLHVFDPTMKPMPHELENATFAISQKYGFTKALNFTYFPSVKYNSITPEATTFSLIGLTNPVLGAEKLKWSEVFDFQEGDEFHYREYTNNLPMMGSAMELLYSLRIVKRENFPDSVRYTQEVKMLQKLQQNAESETVTTFKNYQTTKRIDPNPVFDFDPGLPVVVDDQPVFYINVELNSDLNPEYFFYENGCWRKGMLIDDTCNFIRYAKGRGVVWASSGCFWTGQYSMEQVFYKKGTGEWGTPLVLTRMNEIATDSGVYPSIASTTITVRVKELTNCTFQLMNAQGIIVVQQQLSQLSNEITIESLPDGVYFYRLKQHDAPLKTGKIIKQ